MPQLNAVLKCKISSNSILGDELDVPQAHAKGRPTVTILVDEGMCVKLVHGFGCMEHEALATKVADSIPKAKVNDRSCHVSGHLTLDV